MSQPFNPWKDSEPEPVLRFRYAVTHGETDQAREMLRKGEVDVNLPDHNGRTALYFAGMHGQAAMIDLLVENGADIMIRNNFNENALTVAEAVSRDPKTIETAKKRIAEAEEREVWHHSDRWTQRHIDQTTVVQQQIPLMKSLKLKTQRRAEFFRP